MRPTATRAIRAMHDEVVQVIAGDLSPEDFQLPEEPRDEFSLFNYYDIYETYRASPSRSGR